MWHRRRVQQGVVSTEQTQNYHVMRLRAWQCRAAGCRGVPCPTPPQHCRLWLHGCLILRRPQQKYGCV